MDIPAPKRKSRRGRPNRNQRPLAEDEYGLISGARQPDAGGRHRMRKAYRSGKLLKVGHGRYVSEQRWEGLRWGNRLVTTVLGMVDEASAGVITGAGALALHGAWVLLRGACVGVAGGGQNFAGQRMFRRLRCEIAPEDVTIIAGRRVARLAKAVLDECKMRSRKPPYTRHDRERLQSWRLDALRAAAIAIEGALRHGATREELARTAARYPRQHGLRLFRRALEVCHGRCETPGEVLTKVALLDAGLQFHEQAEIFAPGTDIEPPTFIARVDFLIPSAQLIVEFDGRLKYSRSRVAPTNAEQSQIITDEIYRERALREVGYDVIRVSWDDVDGFPISCLPTLTSTVTARLRILGNSAVRVRGIVKNAGPQIG